jgi:hypothetical protein
MENDIDVDEIRSSEIISSNVYWSNEAAVDVIEKCEVMIESILITSRLIKDLKATAQKLINNLLANLKTHYKGNKLADNQSANDEMNNIMEPSNLDWYKKIHMNDQDFLNNLHADFRNIYQKAVLKLDFEQLGDVIFLKPEDKDINMNYWELFKTDGK